MLDLRFISFFNNNAIKNPVERSNRQALARASAYIRTTARRLVRETKTVKSKPGEPPRSHRKVFKASILFGVDGNNNAVIGPMRFQTNRTNRSGQPVPNILETGGEIAPGANVNWPYGRKGQPKGNSLNDIVGFIQRQGYGPIAWGYSSESMIGKAKKKGYYDKLRKSGKRGQYKTWSRYAPRKGKKVFLQNAHIYSRAQAEKSAGIIMELFGPPHLAFGKMAARPLMGPALEASKPVISGFWRDSMLRTA